MTRVAPNAQFRMSCHNLFFSDYNTIGDVMITKEQLLQEFDYKDGHLYHRHDKTNQINAGDRAGSLHNKGYEHVRIAGERYLSHRIVFLMHHGYLPKYVDHIDNDRLNNRIENLRECTFSENRCNAKKYKNNTSGEKGVHFDKAQNKWKAAVSKGGVKHYVGRFADFESAKSAVRIKRQELHGNFTNNQ